MNSVLRGKKARMGNGVDELRNRRGNERVSFDDVADHLTDYAERNPADGRVIDRLARFLAEVEDVDHDHDDDAGRGLPPERARAPEPP